MLVSVVHSHPCRNLSPECLDFVRRLICDPESRLGGKSGVDEIKVQQAARPERARCGCMLVTSVQRLEALRHTRTVASAFDSFYFISIFIVWLCFMVQSHPWFRGVDWSQLQHMEAPYQPPTGEFVTYATLLIGALHSVYKCKFCG